MTRKHENKSLTLELQQDAMKETSSVGELLRKSFIIAKKLNISELETWAGLELNGYPKGTKVPEYRKIKGTVKVWNPYNGWIRCHMPPRMAQKYSCRGINQSVGSMEVLLNDHSRGDLQIPFGSSDEHRLMQQMEMPMTPTVFIGFNILAGVLQAIRNIILNWSLDLESKGILGEGMSFTKQEKESAMGFNTITIDNFQGILGDVQGSKVEQHLSIEIKKGDLDSLASNLQELGVCEEDIEELKKGIDEDPNPDTKTKFGPRVSKWIGTMASKAASGLLEVEMGSAVTKLSEVIFRYYGV